MIASSYLKKEQEKRFWLNISITSQIKSKDIKYFLHTKSPIFCRIIFHLQQFPLELLKLLTMPKKLPFILDKKVKNIKKRIWGKTEMKIFVKDVESGQIYVFLHKIFCWELFSQVLFPVLHTFQLKVFGEKKYFFESDGK